MTKNGEIDARDARREIAPLVSAYLELAPGAWSADEQMELALATARACDLPRLEALGRAVGDPAPWAVILQHLAVIPRELRTERVLRTVAHLYDLSTQMLRKQGLTLVKPEDLLRREPPYVTMARELLSDDEHDFNSTPSSPW